ncbi:MAG: DUF1080 domain-containing protein [Bacteroidales bacterium]|jgi:hypothetical protein
MKSLSFYVAVAFFSLAFGSCKTEIKNVPVQKVGINEYLGQWTLDIKGGSVGWIEVRQENGYLDADLLWVAGSVNPVANAFLSDKGLILTRTYEVVRKRDDKNNPVRTQVMTDWLEITKKGDKLEGFFIGPKSDGSGVDSTSFTGTKLPPVPPAPDMTALKFGDPINLFNGKDLTGWEPVNEKQKNGFLVVNGILVNDPVQTEGQPYIDYGNLRTVQEFEDFNIKLEVNVPEGSNSGVYLRGMYEVQVLDSYGKPLDSHNMGALYSRIKPSVNAEKPAGTWQTMDITLCDRHVTVILNGIKIIDNQPVYGPTGGAIKSDVFSKGPIYLQGDHGKIFFRNIVITPIVK